LMRRALDDGADVSAVTTQTWAATVSPGLPDPLPALTS
jgi:hypothetical protein